MKPLLQRRPSARDPRIRLLLALVAAAAALAGVGWFGSVRPATAGALLITGPGHQAEYAREVGRLVDGAASRVWVALYVLRLDRDGSGPVTDLVQALGRAAARGVDVRVLLDGGPDPFTGVDDGRNRAAAERLERLGVRVVWDEDRRTTHAKLVVVDGRYVVAGSQNWTRAALTGNREVAIMLDDPPSAARAEGVFTGVPGWP